MLVDCNQNGSAHNLPSFIPIIIMSHINPDDFPTYMKHVKTMSHARLVICNYWNYNELTLFTGTEHPWQ